MDKRYLENPFPDYKSGEQVHIDTDHVKNLIATYVDAILENTRPGHAGPDEDTRGDLYVGNGGIAYMFWKMNRSPHMADIYPCAQMAKLYIDHAKRFAASYKHKKYEQCAFLLGNAGIYAVSAAIAHDAGAQETLNKDLSNFSAGFDVCKTVFSSHGCDEVLVGRAGFLSGCYWLNDVIPSTPIPSSKIIEICEVIVSSGRDYAAKTKAPLPLMYQYHGSEYLGAAHGLCAILQMLIDSPWFKGEKITPKTQNDIVSSINFMLSLQDKEGNFPVALEDLSTGREKRLVHWCHGAPGVSFLLMKAYKVFGNAEYLKAAELAADLIWKKGLLKKGPGICHGVSGNGYVFLILYRLTKNQKYLYRASKFMEFLTNPEFKLRARIPDRPFSLYEGVAGTVCFLLDLLEPEKATFPFMDIFY